MRKHYRIRKGSPADHIINALPYVGLIAMFILTGIMNSWELGLL